MPRTRLRTALPRRRASRTSSEARSSSVRMPRREAGFCRSGARVRGRGTSALPRGFLTRRTAAPSTVPHASTMTTPDRLDIFHLRFLLDLVHTRKLGATAQNFDMSTATASRMLQRLRDAFDDPLFVRGPTGLTPTEAAMRLEEPVRRNIEAFDRLTAPSVFVPEAVERRIVIASCGAVFPEVIERVASELFARAPRLKLTLLHRTPHLWEDLHEGAVDMALVSGFSLPPGLRKMLLFRSPAGIVVRRDHPLARLGRARGSGRLPATHRPRQFRCGSSDVRARPDGRRRSKSTRRRSGPHGRIGLRHPSRSRNDRCGAFRTRNGGARLGPALCGRLGAVRSGRGARRRSASRLARTPASRARPRVGARAHSEGGRGALRDVGALGRFARGNARKRGIKKPPVNGAVVRPGGRSVDPPHRDGIERRARRSRNRRPEGRRFRTYSSSLRLSVSLKRVPGMNLGLRCAGMWMS